MVITPMNESAMIGPRNESIVPKPTSIMLCARANAPYAQALAAGRDASMPFFERKMLQCEKAKHPSRNTTIKNGKAAVRGVLSIQWATCPERSMFVARCSGMSG